MNLRHLAANVKRIRDERHLTQAELGAKLGVSASFISGIELSEKIPSLSRMLELAAALDVQLPRLLEEYK
jgi:transcriptional regulator with XRE-family HTH domain